MHPNVPASEPTPEKSLVEYPSDIIRKRRELRRTNPEAYAKRRRIQELYASGMRGDELTAHYLEKGLPEREARRKATLQCKEDERYERDPEEYKFQCLLKTLRQQTEKDLRTGAISYDDIIESPWPLGELEVTPAQWKRIQAAVPDWVPWKTPAQKEPFDRGFRQRQRAYAAQLFGWFTPAKRQEHWRAWWHAERPETLKNWRSARTYGPRKWATWRAELKRQIEQDERAGA